MLDLYTADIWERAMEPDEGDLRSLKKVTDLISAIWRAVPLCKECGKHLADCGDVCDNCVLAIRYVPLGDMADVPF